MVIVFDAHEGVTPVGNPVAVPIPVALVVVCVMFVKALFAQSVGDDDALVTVSQAGSKTRAIPAISLGLVFTVQFTLPAPVAPVNGFVAHAAPIQAELLALFPTSNSSDKVAGEVIVQLVLLKFAFVVEVSLAAAPNNKTAVLVDKVVTLGMFETLALVAVVQLVLGVTSKGVLLLTPENATIPPTANVDELVTAKVYDVGSEPVAILYSKVPRPLSISVPAMSVHPERLALVWVQPLQ